MPHICNRETLHCIHTSMNHPAGLYVCNDCKAKWEVSWRGNVLTRLTRNNVDRMEKVPSAKSETKARAWTQRDIAEYATAYQKETGQPLYVAECRNCGQKVAFIVIEGSGKRLRCPSCWSVRKGE